MVMARSARLRRWWRPASPGYAALAIATAALATITVLMVMARSARLRALATITSDEPGPR
jgi:hypothetical protein